jgi:hypothetical protein
VVDEVMLYGPASLLISLAALVLASIHLWTAGRGFHTWHDDRAALDLLIAVGLSVVALGVSISALGTVVRDYAGLGDIHGTLAQVGVSVVRGALLVVMAVVVIARHAERRDR